MKPRFADVLTARRSARRAQHVLAAYLSLLASPAFAQDAPAGEPAPDVAPVPDPSPPPADPPPSEVAAEARVAMPNDTPPAVEVTPAKTPFAPWSAAKIALDLELVSHARYASKAGTNLSELRLDRGELGARVGLGEHAAAQLRLEAIRSASDGGALGIDGDSTVVRVKYANVAGSATLGPVIVDGALGFVGDPWIRTIEDGYTLKPLSRTGSERLLGWATSDLAALVRGTVGPVRASVSVGNGEGQRYPERNDGKTTTAVAEVVAVDTDDVRASVAGMFRDGSIGVARVRDRRAGGGATLITPWACGGVEVVKAWGIGDRGDAEGLAIGAWADGRIVEKLHVAARVATLGYAAGGRASTFGGAIAVEPWTKDLARLRIWLAVDRITSSGAAMPLPGADAGDATVAMIIASATAPFLVD